MRKALLLLTIVAWVATPALAAPGESWILPIHHRDGGGWTTLAGAGYAGSDAYQASGMDGVRRVYWELSGVGSKGNLPDPTVKTYTIKFFAPTTGPGNWQPIESQINGAGGETFPIDAGIPWAGMWGTNHQYIGSDFGPAGAWKAAGLGPHTPDSDDYTAGANGDRMWLKSGSWLYAKWDYGWSIDRAWSAIEVTQTPEPASMLLLAIGGAAIFGRKRAA